MSERSSLAEDAAHTSVRRGLRRSSVDQQDTLGALNAACLAERVAQSGPGKDPPSTPTPLQSTVQTKSSPEVPTGFYGGSRGSQAATA